jgi:hypothetical protein
MEDHHLPTQTASKQCDIYSEERMRTFCTPQLRFHPNPNADLLQMHVLQVLKHRFAGASNQRRQTIRTSKTIHPLHDLVECRDQSLCEPEGKDELGSCHQHLRCQPFEEGHKPFILPHLGHDPESALWVFKVAVLYPGLDDIERCGDDEGCTGATDGSEEVLSPCCGIVVFELVEVLLHGGRSTKELVSS